MTCPVQYSGYSRLICVDNIDLVFPSKFFIYQDSKELGLADSSNLIIVNSETGIKINSAVTKNHIISLRYIQWQFCILNHVYGW